MNRALPAMIDRRLNERIAPAEESVKFCRKWAALVTAFAFNPRFNMIKYKTQSFQAVEKVAQPQNYHIILLSALAAPANFSHIQEVCSFLCRFANPFALRHFPCQGNNAMHDFRRSAGFSTSSKCKF
jgi:hypothetical protein